MTKSLAEFVKNRSARDGLTCYCKPCVKKMSKAYREENPEKAKESLIKSNLKNREKRLKYKKEYNRKNAKENAEKAKKRREKNPEKHRTYLKQWRSLESSKRLKANLEAQRRARKLQAMPAWADLEAIKTFYKNCPKGYEIDHIIPLQGMLVTGLHILENLQYLPKEENRSKNNRINLEEITTYPSCPLRR